MNLLQIKRIINSYHDLKNPHLITILLGVQYIHKIRRNNNFTLFLGHNLVLISRSILIDCNFLASYTNPN